MKLNKRIREMINKQKIKHARKTFELTVRGRYFYEYCLKIANGTYYDSDFNFSYDNELNELNKVFAESERFNKLTEEQKRKFAALFYVNFWEPNYRKQFCDNDKN